MIKVTDVGGNEKYINCDLIERIETIPDTLLVLSNGHNFMVTETPEEIIDRIAAFKNRCYKYSLEPGLLTQEEEPPDNIN